MQKHPPVFGLIWLIGKRGSEPSLLPSLNSQFSSQVVNQMMEVVASHFVHTSLVVRSFSLTGYGVISQHTLRYPSKRRIYDACPPSIEKSSLNGGDYCSLVAIYFLPHVARERPKPQDIFNQKFSSFST